MTLKFWIVTKPTEHSTVLDICFNTDAKGLILQGRGGLDPEDILLTTSDEFYALTFALDVIREARETEDYEDGLDQQETQSEIRDSRMRRKG